VSFLIVVVADSWSLACCWAAVSFSQFTFAYLLNSLRLGVYLFWLDLFIYSYAAVRVPHEVMPHTHRNTLTRTHTQSEEIELEKQIERSKVIAAYKI